MSPGAPVVCVVTACVVIACVIVAANVPAPPTVRATAETVARLSRAIASPLTAQTSPSTATARATDVELTARSPGPGPPRGP